MPVEPLQLHLCTGSGVRRRKRDARRRLDGRQRALRAPLDRRCNRIADLQVHGQGVLFTEGQTPGKVRAGLDALAARAGAAPQALRGDLAAKFREIGDLMASD